MIHPPSLLLGALLTLIVGAITYIFLYSLALRSGDMVQEKNQELLIDLGEQALVSLDVPVGAILLYGDSLIGSGYNNVVGEGNAAGHAEINAISDAMRGLGVKQFKQLNRDSLLLISTYEPCPMCRGALLEYSIRNVRFLKPKPLSEHFRQDLRTTRYLLERHQGGDEERQDSLFRLHPTYSSPRPAKGE